MAGYWEGFTAEDIDFYLGQYEGEEKRSAPKREAHKLQGRREKNVRGISSGGRRGTLASEKGSIPDGARLSEEPQEEKPLMTEVEEADMPIITGSSHPVCLRVTEGKGYEVLEKDLKTVSPATLEVFQARQKALEEQNKKRKELLARVLDDRKKQTTEEAKRLKNIQDELHKLDLMLSNDVGILRNQIEYASIEFGEAQKRYNKAEKEYLEAKQTLFNKLERKEMLTKHLCTIIEQNEMRKAQKLSELMEKLRIGENHGSDGISGLNTVILSPICDSALKDKKEDDANASPAGKVGAGC